MNAERPTSDETDQAIRVLAWLKEHPDAASYCDALCRAVAAAYKRVRKQRRIHAARERQHPVVEERPRPRQICYICRSTYIPHEGPYNLLCPDCSATNAWHRQRRGDLSGRHAVITGGRIKVGYHVALKLLRDGAKVTVTTRFPADAARRYAQEPDFAEWRDSLRLYGLDLRDLAGVHRFVASIERSGDLNILINNAAQTIRRPPKYYHELCSGEQAALPGHARKLLIGSPGSMTPELVLKPDVCIMRSSWALPMEEVDTLELAEVMVINAMVPFVLCSRLEPLMKRSRFPDRYVVNVSSAEGQFDRRRKPATHPHTNMAKAALNMLTRTAAERCAASGIYMNSVDPGWITHMQSVEPHSPAENEDFMPPLDVEDGAARLYDPILRGVAGEPVFGLLLRDYSAVSW